MDERKIAIKLKSKLTMKSVPLIVSLIMSIIKLLLLIGTDDQAQEQAHGEVQAVPVTSQHVPSLKSSARDG